MSPKTGPKSQKTASGPPHISDKKKHVANPKNESKKLKNTRFFLTFSWPRFGGRGDEQVYSVLFFYSVFWRRASRPIKNSRFFRKKRPTPQVNLSLSWLMPSGWSRPLHLRCGRIFDSRCTYNYIHDIVTYYILYVYKYISSYVTI